MLANARYKDDIARLEAEQRHLINILAQHQPMCKRQIRRDPSAASASQASGHFDHSNTFRIPALPLNKHDKADVNEQRMKKEIKEINLLGDDVGGGDYSTVHSDCKTESEEHNYKNAFQPPPYEGQKYTNLTYPGYNMGCGYYDSVCAAV